MNFISGKQEQEIHVELKYCERCGGLWLRPQGTDGVYCSGCRSCLAAMPDRRLAPRRRRRKPREVGQGKPANHSQGEEVQGSARIECLQGVAAAEVWA
jgi:Zn-finger nucleic acid-binding protein